MKYLVMIEGCGIKVFNKRAAAITEVFEEGDRRRTRGVDSESITKWERELDEDNFSNVFNCNKFPDFILPIDEDVLQQLKEQI